VHGKTSEINRFTPLLNTLTGVDLAGVVITADALQTVRRQERASRPAREKIRRRSRLGSHR
jgi:hypothetical protein